MNTVGAQRLLVGVEMPYGRPVDAHRQPQLVMENLSQSAIKAAPMSAIRDAVEGQLCYRVDHAGVVLDQFVREPRTP